MNRWSDARRRWSRWGWAALIAGVVLCPVGVIGQCSDAADASATSTCTQQPASLVGLLMNAPYPVTWER